MGSVAGTAPGGGSIPTAADIAAAELFPDVVPLEDFLTWSEWALARVGFRPSNSLPIVAACRDELMAQVEDGVTRTWGWAFQAGALGGLVFAGRTGLEAALGHVPGEDGRHRLVVFVLPHLGIDADGVVGAVQRRGMYRASAACGALVAFRQDLLRGAVDPSVDLDDVEQSLLRLRLGRSIGAGPVPSLVTMTELVRQAALDDMQRYVDLARGREPVDVALVSGIVLHLPDGIDHVASVDASVRIDGTVTLLPH